MSSIQLTRDEIGSDGDTSTAFERMAEKFGVTQGPQVRETRATTDDTLWGVFTWGEKEWDDSYGNIFILGDASLGVLGTSKLGGEKGLLTIQQCKNINKTFIDNFDLTFFTDTEETTADDSIVGEVSFISGEIYQSREVYNRYLLNV